MCVPVHATESDSKGRYIMGEFSPFHWLVVLAIVVLLFGGKKIPEVAKGIGEGIRNFKSALKGDEETAELKKDETKKDEEKVEAKR